MATTNPQPERMTPDEVRGYFHDMLHILTEQNLVIIKLREENNERLERLSTQIWSMARVILKNRDIDPEEWLREMQDTESEVPIHAEGVNVEPGCELFQMEINHVTQL